MGSFPKTYNDPNSLECIKLCELGKQDKQAEKLMKLRLFYFCVAES